ncbi:MAG: hypothetical protein MJK14_08730 [Rivularia sp. ALOHA_DT_140]|nr:hypothetical protein [Rivularia sp. ALOHA_DT_140]
MTIPIILIIIAIILTLLIHKKRHISVRGFYSRKSERGCRTLRRKLLNLVHHDTADRLISSAKRQHPGKSERWYLEKVIYDLQRGR